MITCIVGPTGVGKTKVAVELAKRQDAIIINCDAMQVYKGLDIGTAKITEDEKEGIPHFLFDIVDVDINYTVYNYQKDLRELLKKYYNKNIIIVGGTGLYLKAGLFDYQFYPENKLIDYTNYSDEELYELSIKKDPNHNIHPNNRRRLERFLQKQNIVHTKPKQLYKAHIIGLTTKRGVLYERINKRVDLMFEEGLVEEVKNFYNNNIRTKAIMTGIGYKELYLHFDNKISLAEARDMIKQKTRKYAKRQYTWFNNQLDVKWFDVDFNNINNTIDDIDQFINSRYIK